MLCNLDIKNIAVIENISFAPGEGMTVLTGETGAGKSIIIDSVNLLLGARTNKSLVRFGEKKATVCAMFTLNEKTEKLLTENGIETDDETFVISREIYDDGKSIARINGSMVSLTILREISHSLVNIHGQHDNQALLNHEKHILFLDSYAGTEQLCEDYKELYEKRRALKNEMERLSQNERDRLAKIDLLKYQTEELEKATLKIGEEEELKEEILKISNAEKISSALQAAYGELYENTSSAYDCLSNAQNSMSQAIEYDETVSEQFDKLAEATYMIEDAAHEIKKYLDTVEFDEESLENASERLDLIKRLERKYGGTIDKCIEFYKQASEELKLLQNSDKRGEEIQQETEKLEMKMTELARKLSDRRTAAAKKLSKEIEQQLHELDMPSAIFEASVKKSDKLLHNGVDNVEFLFSANPGHPVNSLDKIASGGELSRVMLAMKTALAKSDDVDTLIFDEIDTGVSGSAAQKIAQKLSLLGKSKQVICISHQPQLAAAADNNFKLEKKTENGVTGTKISLLDFESRVEELARIIDGSNITKAAIEHSREMLERGF